MPPNHKLKMEIKIATLVVSIEFSPLRSAALTNSWCRLHNGDYTVICNRLKIGMNMLSNRFFYLNGKIELDWFNLSFNSFKVKCKKLFL